MIHFINEFLCFQEESFSRNIVFTKLFAIGAIKEVLRKAEW